MNPHQKPQEDMVVTQEDIAKAEQWRFIEGRDSEYEGDFVADLAADFARHRLLGHEAGRRDMREAAGWQPITKETPEVERCLLWCADPGMGDDVEGVCLGRIFINWNGFPKAKANGKMGDWEYTHWRALPTEPLGGDD